MSGFSSVPNVLIRHILVMLPLWAVFPLARVCKCFRDAIAKPLPFRNVELDFPDEEYYKNRYRLKFRIRWLPHVAGVTSLALPIKNSDVMNNWTSCFPSVLHLKLTAFHIRVSEYGLPWKAPLESLAISQVSEQTAARVQDIVICYGQTLQRLSLSSWYSCDLKRGTVFIGPRLAHLHLRDFQLAPVDMIQMMKLNTQLESFQFTDVRFTAPCEMGDLLGAKPKGLTRFALTIQGLQRSPVMNTEALACSWIPFAVGMVSIAYDWKEDSVLAGKVLLACCETIEEFVTPTNIPEDDWTQHVGSDTCFPRLRVVDRRALPRRYVDQDHVRLSAVLQCPSLTTDVPVAMSSWSEIQSQCSEWKWDTADVGAFDAAEVLASMKSVRLRDLHLRGSGGLTLETWRPTIEMPELKFLDLSVGHAVLAEAVVIRLIDRMPRLEVLCISAQDDVQCRWSWELIAAVNRHPCLQQLTVKCKKWGVGDALDGLDLLRPPTLQFKRRITVGWPTSVAGRLERTYGKLTVRVLHLLRGCSTK